MVKREFLEMHDPKRTAYSDFDETFIQLRKEDEVRAEDLKRLRQMVGKPLNNSKKQGQMQNTRFEGVSNKNRENTSSNDGGDGDNIKGRKLENGHSNAIYVHNEDSMINGIVNSIENGSSDAGAFDVNKLQKLRAKGGGKKDEILVSMGSKAESKKRITKKNRVWEDLPPQANLDFTDYVGENEDNIEVVAADHGESIMEMEEIVNNEREAKEDVEVGRTTSLKLRRRGGFQQCSKVLQAKQIWRSQTWNQL